LREVRGFGGLRLRKWVAVDGRRVMNCIVGVKLSESEGKVSGDGWNKIK
jgi:hypothetical protein